MPPKKKMQLSPHYVLNNWCVQLSKNYQGLMVDGQREWDDEDVSWHSSNITSRIDRLHVSTATGSVYQLQGKLDVYLAAERGFTKTFINAFKNGFPPSWQQQVKKHVDKISSKTSASRNVKKSVLRDTTNKMTSSNSLKRRSNEREISFAVTPPKRHDSEASQQLGAQSSITPTPVSVSANRMSSAKVANNKIAGTPTPASVTSRFSVSHTMDDAVTPAGRYSLSGNNNVLQALGATTSVLTDLNKRSIRSSSRRMSAAGQRVKRVLNDNASASPVLKNASIETVQDNASPKSALLPSASANASSAQHDVSTKNPTTNASTSKDSQVTDVSPPVQRMSLRARGKVNYYGKQQLFTAKDKPVKPAAKVTQVKANKKQTTEQENKPSDGNAEPSTVNCAQLSEPLVKPKKKQQQPKQDQSRQNAKRKNLPSKVASGSTTPAIATSANDLSKKLSVPIVAQAPASSVVPEWNAESAKALTLAVANTNPLQPDFWNHIATVVNTGHTAQQCEAYYHRDMADDVVQPTKKKPRKPKPKPSLDKLAGRGTVKRKRQLEEILKQTDIDCYDDLFTSTPMKKATKAICLKKFDDDTEDFDNMSFHFQTPKGLSYTPLPISGRKTPTCGISTPGVLDESERERNDHFVNKLLKDDQKRKRQQCKSKKAGSDTQPRGQSAESHMASAAAAAVWADTGAVVGHEDDHEQHSDIDDYFSDVGDDA